MKKLQTFPLFPTGTISCSFVLKFYAANLSIHFYFCLLSRDHRTSVFLHLFRSLDAVLAWRDRWRFVRSGAVMVMIPMSNRNLLMTVRVAFEALITVDDTELGIVLKGSIQRFRFCSAR